ncbi:MAG: diguanylate cyclase [Pseudomonadota bacterium]
MAGRILIVDSVATNRIVLNVKLASACYNVFQARDGEGALEMIRQEAPDLVVIDLELPDIDGRDLCRKIKADPRSATIPVIICATSLTRTLGVEILKAGAEEYMAKPINEQILMARVRSLLRNRHTADELTLREGTSRALGFSEPGAEPIYTPGSVALIAGDTATSLNWRDALHGRIPDRRHIATREGVLRDRPPETQPDVYVIRSVLNAYGDGLQLLSELRARPSSRHASIVMVIPEGSEDELAMALDLGASDVVREPIDPEEFSHRLAIQMQRKQQSDNLRRRVRDSLRLAVTDPLTGLHNRRYALAHLRRSLELSRESGRSFAVMMLDLDRFKEVNDRHGHQVGDAVLKEVSKRLQDNLRAIDLVARVGGEEFMVLMPDTEDAHAVNAAQRLCRVVDADPIIAQRPKTGQTEQTCLIRQTISIGVAVVEWKLPYEKQPIEVVIESILEETDQALYKAKNGGRNMVTLKSAAA